MTRGAPIDKWQGSNFTDQNKARNASATHVCEACVWVCAWVPPPDRPAADDGKKGLNLRLFSHFMDARGYRSLNKADKPAIRAWLRAPKQGEWFAAIADTGQKHVLPWTPVNACRTGGVVRFEERNLRLPDEAGWAACDALTALLTLGVTKEEIRSGDYSVRSYQQHATAIVEFEQAHGARLRGGAWFDLALWLAQRDEEQYAAGQQQARGAAKQDGKRGAGTAAPVSRGRRKQPEALATDPRPNADGGADERERGRVANEDAASAPDRRSEQLSLFGGG